MPGLKLHRLVGRRNLTNRCMEKGKRYFHIYKSNICLEHPLAHYSIQCACRVPYKLLVLSSINQSLLYCHTNLLCCYTNLLYCYTLNLLYCHTNLLYCHTNLLFCYTNILYCLTNLLYCYTNLLYCYTNLLYCLRNILFCYTNLKNLSLSGSLYL